MVKLVKGVPEGLQGATKFQETEIKGRKCSYLQGNEKNRSCWRTRIIHQTVSLEQTSFEMVNLIQNKLFNTCIHWSYDTAKKFRKKRTRIKGVSTSTKCRRICNCKAERPNQKWTWSANYRMDIWSPPRIKWRESVGNTPQNWFVRRRTFLELLCSSRGLKEPVRTIELCKNVITLFWWLSIRPCV